MLSDDAVEDRESMLEKSIHSGLEDIQIMSHLLLKVSMAIYNGPDQNWDDKQHNAPSTRTHRPQARAYRSRKSCDPWHPI